MLRKLVVLYGIYKEITVIVTITIITFSPVIFVYYRTVGSTNRCGGALDYHTCTHAPKLTALKAFSSLFWILSILKTMVFETNLSETGRKAPVYTFLQFLLFIQF